jgi:hypothetical protein
MFFTKIVSSGPAAGGLSEKTTRRLEKAADSKNGINAAN